MSDVSRGGLDSRFLSKLKEMLGGSRVSTTPAHREAASHDESSLPAVLPDVVVWPESADHVVCVVKHAAAAGVPVTPRGAGSSLEGNPIPVHGGIVLDLTKMDRVLAIRSGDLQVDVEPGVVYDALNRRLQPQGLVFPPSPGGSGDVATIGGMVANDASGVHAVKYGGTRSHVLAATIVTGTGAIMRLGSRCRKSSSGYHLVGLIVGSEGTLGIATELTLGVVGLPQARRRGVYAFDDETSAARVVALLIQYGIDVAAVEFLDRQTVAAVNSFRGVGLVEKPSLFLEVHGSSSTVEEGWSAANERCLEGGGERVGLPGGQDPWGVRHYVTRAIMACRPGASVVRTDLAFPISALPEMVGEAYSVAARHGVKLYTFGHAGIGILHALILADVANSNEWVAAQLVRDQLVQAALAHGGAISGEHGIGLGNRRYFPAEHGIAVDFMRQIKGIFDPAGILNPGKIW